MHAELYQGWSPRLLNLEIHNGLESYSTESLNLQTVYRLFHDKTITWLKHDLYMAAQTLIRSKHIEAEQKGCHFADIFRQIFLNEKVSSFLSNGSINHIEIFVQIMARRRPGDEPLSEPTVY